MDWGDAFKLYKYYVRRIPMLVLFVVPRLPSWRTPGVPKHLQARKQAQVHVMSLGVKPVEVSQMPLIFPTNWKIVARKGNAFISPLVTRITDVHIWATTRSSFLRFLSSESENRCPPRSSILSGRCKAVPGVSQQGRLKAEWKTDTHYFW